MKKILLITITLLILSFPTFGEIDGKGLVCECSFECNNKESPEGYFENYKFIHFDKGPKITSFTYEDKDKVNFYYSKPFYRILDKKIEIINEELNLLVPVFRKFLSASLNLRSTPTLKFFYDDSFEQFEKIDKLIKKID